MTAPPRVENIQDFWADRPSTRSARCSHWVGRFSDGFTPNRRIRAMSYYCAAEFYGVWVWELLNVIRPLEREAALVAEIEKEMVAFDAKIAEVVPRLSGALGLLDAEVFVDGARRRRRPLAQGECHADDRRTGRTTQMLLRALAALLLKRHVAVVGWSPRYSAALVSRLRDMAATIGIPTDRLVVGLDPDQRAPMVFRDHACPF